mmetsp:Transcript_14773/g.31298  ORF Transcript_14773/g.31298 Transcript_14773/m.31298 type:complete len:147 (-) Transcript_14773:15-455(-)
MHRPRGVISALLSFVVLGMCHHHINKRKPKSQFEFTYIPQSFQKINCVRRIRITLLCNHMKIDHNRLCMSLVPLSSFFSLRILYQGWPLLHSPIELRHKVGSHLRSSDIILDFVLPRRDFVREYFFNNYANPPGRMSNIQTISSEA